MRGLAWGAVAALASAIATVPSAQGAGGPPGAGDPSVPLETADQHLVLIRPAAAAGEKPAPVVAFDDELAAALAPTLAEALATADPVRGEEAFDRECAGCHSLDKDGTPHYGPSLFGVFGSVIGTRREDAPRVTAAQEAGLIWTAARFNAFLADVQGAWPGNGMPVRGYDDPQLRADFILFFALEVEP